MVNYDHILNNLRQNKGVIQSLFDGVSEEQQRWKPSEGSWCMLEVLSHLLDEERLDFRFRVEFVLNNPGEIPPPFNPLEWVTAHDYMNRDYKLTLKELIDERSRSVDWLESLENPDWDLSFEHPKLGRLTAGYFLNNWLAHDYLHIRQANRFKY